MRCVSGEKERFSGKKSFGAKNFFDAKECVGATILSGILIACGGCKASPKPGR